MTRDELIEQVALAIEAADNERVADGLYKGSDPNISDWGVHIARAAINVVLEEAAKVALEQRCERVTPWDQACLTIAAAIRALKGE